MPKPVLGAIGRGGKARKPHSFYPHGVHSSIEEKDVNILVLWH
jgi:hypothetical protein